MARLMRVLRSAFRSPASKPRIRDHEAVKDEIARGVVRSTATGNVRLQRGQYLTSEEVAKELKRVKGYSFDAQE